MDQSSVRPFTMLFCTMSFCGTSEQESPLNDHVNNISAKYKNDKSEYQVLFNQY